METRADIVEHYRSMRAELLVAVAGLGDEQLSEASLDGWSVKDHLLHIALWDEIRASEVERISVGHDSLWRMTPEQEGPFEGIFYQLRRDASPAQAKWELAATHARFIQALTSATDRALEGSLYGEAGLVSDHEAAHTSWITRWRGERGY